MTTNSYSREVYLVNVRYQTLDAVVILLGKKVGTVWSDPHIPCKSIDE